MLLSAAGTPAATPIPHGSVQLVAEYPSLAAGHNLNLGLRFELEPDWHIYWRNPGDSGEPPRVQWQLPAGITAGEMQWPTPQRLGTSSIADFGYEHAVTLIVPIHADPNLSVQQAAQLSAQLSVLVCRDVCIPGKAQLSLILPIKSPTPTDKRTSQLFTAARQSLPQHAPASWKFRASVAGDSFVLTANVGHQIMHATFFPLAESQMDNAAPQPVLPTATGFHLTLRKSNQLFKPLERLKGVLVLDADQANTPARGYVIDVPLSNSGAART